MLKKSLALLCCLVLAIAPMSGVPLPGIVKASAAGYVWGPIDFDGQNLNGGGGYVGNLGIQNGTWNAQGGPEIAFSLTGGALNVTVVSGSYKRIIIQTGGDVGGTEDYWTAGFKPTAGKEYKVTFDANIVATNGITTGAIRVRGNPKTDPAKDGDGTWAQKNLTEAVSTVTYTYTQDANGGNLELDTGGTAVGGCIAIDNLKIEEVSAGGDEDEPESSTIYDMQEDSGIKDKTTGTAFLGSDGLSKNGGNDDGGVTIEIVDNAAGGKSLKFTDRTANSGVDIKSTLFKDHDIQYTITVMGRFGATIDSNPPGDNIVLQASGSKSGGTYYKWIASDGAAVNKPFTLSVTTSINDIIAANGTGFDKFTIQVQMTSDFFIDSIIITKPDGEGEDEDPPSVFPVTFENGQTDPCKARGNGSDAKIQIIDNAALARVGSDGTHFLEAYDRANTWQGVQFDAKPYVESGDVVEFSAWVRLVEAGSSKINLSYYKKSGSVESGWSQLSGAKGITVTADAWVQLKGTALLFFDANEDVVMYIESGDLSSFYVDDINFTVIDHWNTPEWNLNLSALKSKYSFLVGNIMAPDSKITHLDDSYHSAEMFVNQYNVVTAENAMKPSELSKVKDTYNYTEADKLVSWAKNNNVKVHGHTLVWHSQSPEWLNVGLTRAQAKENMQNYISNVAGHFKGKVISWDVVNEAFRNDAEGFTNNDWRTALRTGDPTLDPDTSDWYKAYANGAGAGESGADYIYDAFVFARQADSGARLYYNDYNEDIPDKREAIALMVEDLNNKWKSDANYDGRLLIEGIGMQSHYWMGEFDISRVDAAIARFVKTGARISVSELDMPMGTYQTPFTGVKLTEAEEYAQAVNYAKLFLTYKKYAAKIDRVTFWGMADISSWRTNLMALLFDNSLHAKKAYDAVMNPENYATISSGGDSPTSSPSSSGGGGGSSDTPKTVTSSNVSSDGYVSAQVALTEATKALQLSGSANSAVIRTVNAVSISAATLKSLAAAASKAGKELVVHADTLSADNKGVQGRLYVEPTKLANLTGDVKLGIFTDSAKVSSTKNMFEKFFNNKVAVIRCEQQGSFGAKLQIAAKINLSGMDAAKLVFYSYDKATKAYKALPSTAYFIDINGYLHFYTELAGDIVVSDGALAKK